MPSEAFNGWRRAAVWDRVRTLRRGLASETLCVCVCMDVNVFTMNRKFTSHHLTLQKRSFCLTQSVVIKLKAEVDLIKIFCHVCEHCGKALSFPTMLFLNGPLKLGRKSPLFVRLYSLKSY